MDTITRTDEEVRGDVIVGLPEKKIEVEMLVEGHGGDIVDFLRLASYVVEPDESRVLGVSKRSGLQGYFRRVLGTLTWGFVDCRQAELDLILVALDAASLFGYELGPVRVESCHTLCVWEPVDP